MEKLQQVSPYTPYTYLAVKDGVYTLFTIIPIYQGQQINIYNRPFDERHNYQEIHIRVSGLPSDAKRIILKSLKEVLAVTKPIDIADIKGPEGGGEPTDDSDNTVNPINQVKCEVKVQTNSSINKQAALMLEDADQRPNTTSLTAYNCPYSYLFKKGTAKQVCLSVIIPLQGFKYHPSLEETIVDKTTKRVVKTITLTKDPIYSEVYGGVAIPPVVTYQYGNGISTSDFFEVEVKLFESNMISYAKSKPRTINPDEL